MSLHVIPQPIIIFEKVPPKVKLSLIFRGLAFLFCQKMITLSYNQKKPFWDTLLYAFSILFVLVKVLSSSQDIYKKKCPYAKRSLIDNKYVL